MRALRFVIAVSLFLLGVLSRALAETDAPAEHPSDRPDSICRRIASAARTNALPVDFFARVIWQESRFRPYEVGPVTRNGERAQGIAQFMPSTAAERRLLDPFNPVEALLKSADFLAELREQFGNLGLAAAAYNAGPQRVRDFIAGSRGLPWETRNYVSVITGHQVDYWVKPAKDNSNDGNNGEPYAEPAMQNCHDIVALLKRTLNPFVEQMQQRVNLVAASPSGVRLMIQGQYSRVPSWCKHLHHPHKDVCGPIHQAEPLIKT